MPVVNCPIDIPDGWELVKYRVGKHGETCLINGDPCRIDDDSTGYPVLIIRRARPELKVGDWVRLTRGGFVFSGRIGRVESITESGKSRVVFDRDSDGLYRLEQLTKQTRTVEPYTRDECIADAVKLGFPAVNYEGREWGISAYDEFGIYVKQDDLERPFVLYGEAARKVTWSGGEAFGVETWRDAE